MENTLKEYKDWCPDEADPNIEQAYNKAQEKLKQLLPYEDALVDNYTILFLFSHQQIVYYSFSYYMYGWFISMFKIQQSVFCTHIKYLFPLSTEHCVH